MQPFKLLISHRNNDTAIDASNHATNAEDVKQPSGVENPTDWSPVLLEELPPPPPLWNTDSDKGPTISFRVFGFAVLWEELAVMAAKRGYNDGKEQMAGSARMWKDLQNLASPWCRRYSIVKAGRMTSMCLVLATNRTAEDVVNMQDIETIEAVRRVVGIGRMPEWYRVKNIGW